MTAAVVVSALVGFNIGAPLTAMGALSFLQFAGSTGKDIVRLQQQFDTPELRAWAAANGEGAIHLQPGISTER